MVTLVIYIEDTLPDDLNHSKENELNNCEAP